jgi:hypothetical protein
MQHYMSSECGLRQSALAVSDRLAPHKFIDPLDQNIPGLDNGHLFT